MTYEKAKGYIEDQNNFIFDPKSSKKSRKNLKMVQCEVNKESTCNYSITSSFNSSINSRQLGRCRFIMA